MSVLRVQLLNASSLPDEQVAAVAHALDLQVRNEFSDAWHIDAIVEFSTVHSQSLTPHMPPDPTKPWVIVQDGESGRGQFIGYHDHTAAGQPEGWVFLESVGAGDAWSRVASHELLEMLVNPYGTYFARSTGMTPPIECALEVCDAVEGRTYQIDGVTVEDFCYPAWFRLDGSGTLDHQGVTAGPFVPQPGGRMPS